MVSFLFWNLNRKPLAGLLRALVDDFAPEVVVLAECRIALDILLETINKDAEFIYRLSREPTAAAYETKLVLLSRLPRQAVRSLMGRKRVALRRIFPPLETDLLLVGLHLSSKLHLNEKAQAHLTTRLRPLIEGAEAKTRHQRTVVMGDLNMDPFESGVTSSETLHGVMTRQIAAAETRRVDAEERRFFYNPMWSRLGDATPGPPGTYYRPASGPLANHWYTFDQVLIRPALLPNFKDQNLRVLTEAGSVSLLSDNGIPDRAVGSDHLPLLLTLTTDVNREKPLG